MSIDTIYALSSGAVPSGVAVVRVSGPKAGVALKAITGSIGAPRQLFHVKHFHPSTKALIDDGLSVWFPAPHSFTGEDVVEFQIHGGRSCVDGLLEALGSLEGCRLAQPGEFTRRAFEHGKLDLTEAEAVGDLVAADTAVQREQALRQLGGAASDAYETWRADILHCCAMVEADLDFADEGDVSRETSVAATLRTKVEALSGSIEGQLNDERRGELIRGGLHVVIAGVPNSGKSSLFNLLAKNDAAIVSDIAGTTRDSLSVLLDIEGFAVKLTDTAGLRSSDDLIEREGMKRSYQRASEADVLIWLIDGTNPVLEPPEDLPGAAQLIKVWNKVDVSRETFADASASLEARGQKMPLLPVSAKDGTGLEVLFGVLAERLGHDPKEPPLITRARHREHLQSCAAHLQAFLKEDDAMLELRAEDLRLAADQLGRITGRLDVEEVLGAIFSQFCIGK